VRQGAELKTTSSAEQLRTLVDATRALAEAAADSEQLRLTIVRQAGRLFRGYSLLAVISDDGTSWHVAGDFSPCPEEARKLSRAVGALRTDSGGPTVTATLARSARPALTDDVFTDGWRRRVDPGLWAIVEPFVQRGAICVPLRARDEVIGTIAVGRLGDEGAVFGDADVDLLHVLAEHAAQAILLSRSRLMMQREVAAHRQTRATLRRVEEGLRQAAKMEVLGRLTGSVAHDFNNILSIIAGYTDLLLGSTSPSRDDIEQIQRASQHGSALTRQLLAFSRKEPFLPGRADLNQVVLGLRPMLERLLGRYVELHVATDPELPTCQLDPTHAEQVLMNLVINAKDAMPAGGQLTIETAHVRGGAAGAATHEAGALEPHVVLSVTDTGMGMPEDVRARIFEPFFTTKPTGVGTGLGLATVCGIVEQSGGSIRVDSKPGRGTTFRLEFPVSPARAPQTLPEAAPERSRPLGAGIVLAHS
jgi:signal transduction histidine kinase